MIKELLSLDAIIKCSIEEYITQKPHNGRRGSPKIPSGIKLFVIKYDIGGYFTYSYFSRSEAELVFRAGIEYDTNTKRYYDFNVVNHPEKTMHVGKLAIHEQ